MFRISAYVNEVLHPTPLAPKRKMPAPVIIWNLIRRCNLDCAHCYSASSNKHFPGELNTSQVFAVMDDLWQYGVRSLILSGGEPLMRDDIFDIARRAKAMGFYVGLSSNGTLITQNNIDEIDACGFDYVGISLDGIGARHDKFRGMEGAFDQSMVGLRLCRDLGLKVGLRFTLTQGNVMDLPAMLQLLEDESVDRFYFSHLNYAGRGGKNRDQDAHHQMTRGAMDLIFDTCLKRFRAGRPIEFTSGNNDADGVYFLLWVRQHFPERAADIKARLMQWGGNSSGINIANIDNRGNVHPDTMWWHVSLGNVLERPFSKIWSDNTIPLLAELRRQPRPVKGRCAVCQFRAICNGNTRVRALKASRDMWAEDPGCYLSDEEIGVNSETHNDTVRGITETEHIDGDQAPLAWQTFTRRRGETTNATS